MSNDNSIEPIYPEPSPVGFIARGAIVRSVGNGRNPVLSLEIDLPQGHDLNSFLSKVLTMRYKLKVTIELDKS